jgi:hypothetical protein
LTGGFTRISTKIENTLEFLGLVREKVYDFSNNSNKRGKYYYKIYNKNYSKNYFVGSRLVVGQD